jgi:sporulation protein YlmC with PRC-barrel domain
MRKKYLWLGMLAALGASAAIAADAEVNVKTDSNSPRAETRVETGARRTEEHQYKQEVRIESTVRPINRAHNIIGMEVRNRNDERLGEVKDIVMDLQSGRVAYVALSVGGFLGIGEKLIAVPTSAIATSEHSDKYLVMDATRGEIVDAPSFAATNWPDYRNPNFDQSPFWRPRAHGAAAGHEVGRARLTTEPVRRPEVKVDTSVKTK